MATRNSVKKAHSQVASDSVVTADTPERRTLKIGEARKRLPDLVRTVDDSSVVYTIGQRGKPTAAVLSYNRVKALFGRKIEPKLALVIVEQLLPDAPPHLRTPAVDELSGLSSGDLLQLLTIDCLPLSRTKTRELKKGLEHPEALDRLVRRFELATAISRARDAGLYEVAEHQASNVLTAK